MKVIHLYPLTLHESYRLDAWHARTARELAKRQPQYEVECWTIVDRRLTKNIEVFRDEKITHRLIPSYDLPSSLPFRNGYSPICPKFITALKNVAVAEECIIHIHGDAAVPLWVSLLLKDRKQRIVIQDHGSRLTRRLPRLLERSMLRRADHIFVLTNPKAHFLIDTIGVDRSKVSIQAMGVDFDFFTPEDKLRARERLGLPPDKLILLYVGRPVKEKGFHLVIDCWKALREKHDVELVFAGRHAGPLDNLIKKEVKYRFHHSPLETMPTYYNAGSVFMWFLEDAFLQVGGTGTAVVEALACNTPVVSNSLIHAPSDIRSSLGSIPRVPADLPSCFEEALKMADGFRGREAARRYWSWDVITQNTVKVYQTITERKR